MSDEPLCVLRPPNLHDAGEVAMAVEWLQRDEVRKWLDFGLGRQTITAAQFTFMVRNPANRVYFFCEPMTMIPVGIVALQGVTNAFKVAEQWGLRGNFEVGSRNIALAASRENLRLGFNVLGLTSVVAWAAETNRPSLAVLRRAGFVETGRLRRAHLVDGVAVDRIMTQVMAEEFAELEARRAANGKAALEPVSA